MSHVGGDSVNRIAFVLLSLSLVACFDQRIDVTETVDVMDETDAVDVTADLGSDIASDIEIVALHHQFLPLQIK